MRFLGVVWMLSITTIAHAYELKELEGGRFVRWQRSTVVLHVAEAPRGTLETEDVVRALRMSCETWRGIHGAPDVVVEVGAPDEPSFDRLNTVHVLRRWPRHLGNALAVTVSTYDYGGRLLDTDILINAEHPLDILDEAQPERRFDLPSVLAHEVGHVLGLDESDVPDATMYHRLRRGQVFQRTLDEDDELALYALYGSNVDDAPMGCDAGGGRTSWLLILMWALLLVPRREPIRSRVRSRVRGER